MKSRLLVIISQLFFNKYGNQSFYETLKGYSRNFELILITAYDKSDDFYYKPYEIEVNFDIEIPNMFFYNIYKRFCKLFRKIKSKNKKKNKTEKDLKISKNLVNQHINFLTKLSFEYKNRVLIKKVREVINRKDLKKYDTVYIVAYEIGGVLPALFAKDMLDKSGINNVVIAKFQGTQLGQCIDETTGNMNKECLKLFPLDLAVFEKIREFDGVIMTDDGTKGDMILKKFGVDNILFITNGIPEEFIRNLEIANNGQIPNNEGILNLYTISRLIYWKRVDLAVKIASFLKNNIGYTGFRLNIYGKCSEDNEYCVYLRKIVKDENLNEYVIFHGGVPYPKVPSIHLSNDVLLSLYNITNVTNPVFEALYVGNHVITLKDPSTFRVFGGNECVEFFERSSDESQIIENIANFIVKNAFKLKAKNKLCSKKIITWEDRISREIEFILSTCKKD